MKLKLRPSEILLIAGFWLVGCALLGIVFYFTLGQDGEISTVNLPDSNVYAPQATYTVENTRITANTQASLAQSNATSWNNDAQLVSIVSNWDKASLSSVDSPTSWTYRYYSPSQKRIFFTTVNPDGQVLGTSHAERIYNKPITIPASGWGVDSSTAVNLWINHTGAAMLENLPDTLVVAQLHQPTQDAPLTWTVSGYDPGTKHYHTVFVNANNGEILEIESSLR